MQNFLMFTKLLLNRTEHLEPSLRNSSFSFLKHNQKSVADSNFHLSRQTSVSPWHADGAQSEGQRDIFRPVWQDGGQGRPITDGVSSPAAMSDNTSSHRKSCVFTLDHSAEK